MLTSFLVAASSEWGRVASLMLVSYMYSQERLILSSVFIKWLKCTPMNEFSLVDAQTTADKSETWNESKCLTLAELVFASEVLSIFEFLHARAFPMRPNAINIVWCVPTDLDRPSCSANCAKNVMLEYFIYWIFLLWYGVAASMIRNVPIHRLSATAYCWVHCTL